MYNKEVKVKLKEVIKRKYGVENISQSVEIKNKKRETCLEKYGVDNPSKCPNWKKKVVETNLNRHNADWYSKTKEYKKKAEETNLDKYGVRNINQKHLQSDVLELIYNENKFKQWLINKHHKEKLSGDEIADLLGITNRAVHRYFSKFNIEAKRYLKSGLEKNVSSYISEYISIADFYENDRVALKGQEIDIYIPKHNLGLEVNGLYWHSYNRLETKEEKLKHQYKTLQCLDQGIKLLQIFENEWLNSKKRKIWESIIICLLGQSEVIYARKCKLKKLNKKESKTFLEDNHIQGYKGSKLDIGLYYNEELVSVMSFGKSRYTKKYEWEIIRYASKLNTRIVGGASKLFKYFLRNYKPKSIISYCDLRYGTGKVYEKLGFKLSHITKPNYYYFIQNENILYSRLKFQKHKLPNLLENFNPDLSEAENMFNNGYKRIWDCGNKVFTYYNTPFS